MNDNRNRKNQLIAVAITILVTLLLLLLLVSSYITYDWPPKDAPEMQIDSTEILFGGEYVMLGDFPELAESQPASSASEDGANEDNEPESLISTDDESPLQTAKPEKPVEDPKVKAEKERREREAAEKARKEQEAREKAQKISNSVAKGFSKGAGSTGSPAGNSTTGATDGTPGYDLSGRTAEYWGRPSSPVTGTVVVRVRVNPQGRVTEATYQSGSGSASANRAVRNSCVQASLNSRFSVASNRTTDQIGTITWRFE